MKRQKTLSDTAGSIMSTAIPTCKPSDTREAVLKHLAGEVEWDDVHHVYVVDEAQKLLGYVRLRQLVRLPATAQMSTILRRNEATLSPNDDQELAIIQAVKNNIDSIPVIDAQGKLLGAVMPKSIIGVMHNEHVEDVLFASGIRRSPEGAGILRLVSARVLPAFKARAPWLIVGALGGILLGVVPSYFEATLKETIAIAYFIPVVAYVAASVGTQAEAITVRTLAVLRVNPIQYIGRELWIGAMLGVTLGTLAGLGALVISQDPKVALAVFIALCMACTVATGMAALVAIMFKALGKDPAVGSGPIATALQDVLSIVIYFVVASLIIGA